MFGINEKKNGRTRVESAWKPNFIQCSMEHYNMVDQQTKCLVRRVSHSTYIEIANSSST